MARARHILCEAIGTGTFSVVRRAVDPLTNESMACKVVELTEEDAGAGGAMAQAPGARRRRETSTRKETENEISMLRLVKGHPSVTSLSDSYEREGSVHIVTELLRGGELLDVVDDRGSLPEEDARQIFVRLMKALRHIHAAGVVHRDVKLENLVIADPDDMTSVKLIDFGLAAPLDGPPLRHACGTPKYVAPEVLLSGNGTGDAYGAECDVWSAGVVLFQILVGYPPFDAASVRGLVRQICYGAPNFNDPAWAMVSPQAVQLVVGLLAPDPCARLTPDEALRHPWVLAGR